MPSVTGLTAARMEEIEAQSIVDGNVVGDDLVLTRFDGGTINAGNVRGPQGIQGPTGPVPEAPVNDRSYVRNNAGWVLATPRIITTSGARPSVNLVNGQEIFETDTGFVRMWDGTRWIVISGSVESLNGSLAEVGAAGTWLDVQSVVVQPGKWTIACVGRWTWSVAAAGPEYRNRLFNSTASSELDLKTFNVNRTNASDKVALLGVVDVTVASTIKHQGRVDDAAGTQFMTDCQLVAQAVSQSI